MSATTTNSIEDAYEASNGTTKLLDIKPDQVVVVEQRVNPATHQTEIQCRLTDGRWILIDTQWTIERSPESKYTCVFGNFGKVCFRRELSKLRYER
jgi:hypothetical protein